MLCSPPARRPSSALWWPTVPPALPGPAAPVFVIASPLLGSRSSPPVAVYPLTLITVATTAKGTPGKQHGSTFSCQTHQGPSSNGKLSPCPPQAATAERVASPPLAREGVPAGVQTDEALTREETVRVQAEKAAHEKGIKCKRQCLITKTKAARKRSPDGTRAFRSSRRRRSYFPPS